MNYIDKYGVEYSDDRKTLIKCPEDFKGEYIIPNSVTKIGDCAFYHCTGLTSIEIPNSVTEIGNSAFSWCEGLTSIEIPNSVQLMGDNVFTNCESLPFVNGICYLGTYLYGVYNETLSSYKIKEGTKWVGDFAFYDEDGQCNISDIYIPNGIIKIGRYAFAGCPIASISIPESVQYIGCGAFCHCNQLLSIKLPNKLKSIEDGFPNEAYSNGIFQGCQNLKSVEIPNSVMSIGSYAFQDCPALTTIEIPNSIESINWRAFDKCRALKRIVIPNSVNYIEYNAFVNISSDLYIVVDPCNSDYCSNEGSLYTKSLQELIHHCSLNINTYQTPLAVEIINVLAFEWSTVKKVVLSEGVKEIQFDAFWWSHNDEIFIPSTITTIGRTAFKHSEIKKLHINHEHPEQIDVATDAFDECAKHCTLYVPIGTGYAYRNHPVFGKFKEVIVEEAKSEDYSILLTMAKGFELGIGVTKDINQAISLYSQTVEKGCAKAAYHLGELYEKDEVISQDYQTAADWYSKAADLGYPLASNKKQACLDKLQEENERMQTYQQEMFANQRVTRSAQDAPIHSAYLFFDTETTGIPYNYKAPCTNTDNWPRMVQLAWIATDEQGQELKRGTHIIKPEGYYIPSDAAAVHGITTERANREGEDLSSVLQEFYSMLTNAKVIVGHNVDFDIHIVGAEMCRKNMDYTCITTKHHICTMQSTINYCAIPSYNRYGGYKYPKLQELYTKLFGHPFEDAHDAMADITATKECYFELVKRGIIK